MRLWLLHQLAQELAVQLDNEWGSWQVPVFETEVPPSDSQFVIFFLSASLKP